MDFYIFWDIFVTSVRGGEPCFLKNQTSTFRQSAQKSYIRWQIDNDRWHTSSLDHIIYWLWTIFKRCLPNLRAKLPRLWHKRFVEKLLKYFFLMIQSILCGPLKFFWTETYFVRSHMSQLEFSYPITPTFCMDSRDFTR